MARGKNLRKAAHNGPTTKHYYFDCPECKSEQEVLRVLVVSKGRTKRLMCKVCRFMLTGENKVTKK